MMEEVLGIRRRLLRENHPLVIQSLANLGVMAAAAGNLQKGEQLLRQVVALDREVFGEGHPSLAIDLAGLGRILMLQKRHAEAEVVLRESLEIRRRRLPPDDFRTLLTQVALGRCLAEMDRPTDAEPLLAEALARAFPQLHAPEQVWLDVADELARLYESMGDARRTEEAKAMKAAIAALQ